MNAHCRRVANAALIKRSANNKNKSVYFVRGIGFGWQKTGRASRSSRSSTQTNNSSNSIRNSIRSIRSSSSADVVVVSAMTTAEQCGASIYAQPELYACAFGGFRDFEEEVKFLERVHAKNDDSNKRVGKRERKMTRMLELGCGPAWHSIAFAKRDLKENCAVAVDLSEEMVEFASKLSSDCEGKVDCVKGDMRYLEQALPEKYLNGTNNNDDGYFDCVALLLGTAAHLVTSDDLEKTLRSAFRVLEKGGIFVVEVEHPYTALFSGDAKDGISEENQWEVRKCLTEQGEEMMRIVWGQENDSFNCETQVLSRTVTVQKYFVVREQQKGGGPPTIFVREPHYENKEIVQSKLFTCPEFTAVARIVGFNSIGCFGGLDMAIPFTDEENAQNMVLAFQRPF